VPGARSAVSVADLLVSPGVVPGGGSVVECSIALIVRA
jgi:hypothetical protein